MQQNERNTALYEAILRLNSLDECIRFFDDLCAVTELRTMEQRYAVAGCLLQGKVYSEIRRETGASSATVRGSHHVCFDSGFRQVHQRPDR